MKNRIISILLIALTLISILCFSINAADISPYWINTSSVTCNLMFSSDTGYISASVVGQSGTSRIESTVTVYRKTGTIWIYVDSWNKNENSEYISITGVFTGASGVTYKAVITANVIKGGVSEPVTASSNTATCQ
jgi:hypothetical protein